MEDSTLSNFIDRYERVYFMVSRKVSALIAEQIGEELTIEQHYAIRYLASRKQCSVSELADVLLVKPSAVTSQMNRLVSRGFVSRIRDEQDRRVVYLSLTEKGYAVLEEAEEKIHQVITPYLSKLTEDELMQFVQTYEKIEHIIKQEY